MQNQLTQILAAPQFLADPQLREILGELLSEPPAGGVSKLLVPGPQYFTYEAWPWGDEVIVRDDQVKAIQEVLSTVLGYAVVVEEVVPPGFAGQVFLQLPPTVRQPLRLAYVAKFGEKE